MRNATYCLLVVLFGSWSSSLGQKAPQFTTPQIVATFQRLNQTKQLGPVTLYTPPQWGMFRISIVAVGVVANGENGQWSFGVQFTDGAGTTSGGTALSTASRETAVSEFPIRAKAGVPIKLSVIPNDETSGSQYNIFVVVEQLM
jgi:hypothetical protein